MQKGVDEKMYELARELIGGMGATADEIQDLAENFQIAFEDMTVWVEERIAEEASRRATP